MERKQLVIVENNSPDPCISFFNIDSLANVVVTDTSIEVTEKGEGMTEFTHGMTKEKAWDKLRIALGTDIPLIL